LEQRNPSIAYVKGKIEAKIEVESWRGDGKERTGLGNQTPEFSNYLWY
jgi:hypothetical protein